MKNNKHKWFVRASIALLGITSTGLMAGTSNVDLSRDDLDTIRHVGQEYIKSTFHGKTIHFEAPKVNWFSNGEKKALDGKGEIQAGGHNARFRVDDGPLQIRKLQLAKKNGRWQVVNELSAEQIHEAHPQVAPHRDKPRYTLRPVAARHFEKHFYTQLGGWQKIKEPLFFSCAGANEAQKAYCEVPYGIFYKGDFKINGSFLHTKCSAKTYLFEQKNGQWVIEKILPANMQVNKRTLEVQERKGDIWGC